ncbi:hypothetical protein TWF173_003137 [Orbilia oligospora]|nr:hypothetical protein TWF173_003137 [Orbilia oligospora]
MSLDTETFDYHITSADVAIAVGRTVQLDISFRSLVVRQKCGIKDYVILNLKKMGPLKGYSLARSQGSDLPFKLDKQRIGNSKVLKVTSRSEFVY